MSGKTLRFTWDGDTYEMPEEEALGVMQELGKRGIQVNADSVPEAPQAAEQPIGTTPSGIQLSADPRALAEWNAGGSLPAAGEPAPTPAPAPEPERDWVDELADGFSAAGRGLKEVFLGGPTTNKYAQPIEPEKAEAAAAGTVHGATMGTGRLLPPAIGGETYRRWDDAQRAAHPDEYQDFDMVGSFASPANLLIPGSGVASNVAKAGVEGAVRGFSDAKPGEGLMDAATGGAADAAAGLVFGSLGTVGRWGRDVAPIKADINRVAATGAYGSQIKRMAQNKGADYVPKLGRAIEEQGLHLADPSKSRWNPTNWIPQGADTYADNAAALEQRALQGMKKSEDAISTLGAPPTVRTTDMINDLRREATGAGSKWDPAGTSEARFRNNFANRIEGASTLALPPPGSAPGAKPLHYADWDDALAQRRYLDENINWSQLGGYKGAPMEEQVRRQLAGDVRAELNSSLDRGVASGTVPEDLSNTWKQARDDYSLAAAVRDPSIGRVFQEYGNQKVSLPSMAAFGGALAGGNPITAATALGAGQLMKHRGAGTLADLQRLGGNLTGWGANAGDALDRMGPAMRTPLSTAMPAFNTRPSPEQQRDPYTGRATGPEEQVARQDNVRLRDSGRGHLLADNIVRMLTENPQFFGEHAREFLEAENLMKAEALAERLAHEDEDFAKNKYPKLIGSPQ